jgi:hypothetical protein
MRVREKEKERERGMWGERRRREERMRTFFLCVSLFH